MSEQNTTIQPALTPEEWVNEGHFTREGVWAYRPDGMKGGVLPVGFLGESGVGLPEEAWHALAALALHDQPYGFTWADVDALRAAYAVMEMEESGKPSAATLRLRDLADRIAALLPPREGT